MHIKLHPPAYIHVHYLEDWFLDSTNTRVSEVELKQPLLGNEDAEVKEKIPFRLSKPTRWDWRSLTLVSHGADTGVVESQSGGAVVVVEATMQLRGFRDQTLGRGRACLRSGLGWRGMERVKVSSLHIAKYRVPLHSMKRLDSFYCASHVIIDTGQKGNNRVKGNAAGTCTCTCSWNRYMYIALINFVTIGLSNLLNTHGVLALRRCCLCQLIL